MDAYSVMYQYENEVNMTCSEAALHPVGLKELASGQWWVVFGEKGAVSIKRDSGLFYEMWDSGEPRQLLTPDQQKSTRLVVRVIRGTPPGVPEKGLL